MSSLQSQILSSLGTGGCPISKLQGELNDKREGFLSNVVSNYQAACRTDRFLHHFLHSGLEKASFKPNANLLYHDAPCIHKFEQGLTDLPPSAQLGLVFHGTPRENIASILLHGLDPRKRKRQSYGPGEYFSTHPEISLKYSNGLREIIVCLVILPESVASSIMTTAQRRPKPSIIVVRNDKHHLPLGTISFGLDPSNGPVEHERRENAVMQRSIREKQLSRKLELEHNRNLIWERAIAGQQELEQNKKLIWEREISRLRELEREKKLSWEKEIAIMRELQQKNVAGQEHEIAWQQELEKEKKLFWEREIARLRELEQEKKLFWETEIAGKRELEQKKKLSWEREMSRLTAFGS